MTHPTHPTEHPSGHTSLCEQAAVMLGLDPDECDPDYDCWSDLPDPEPDTAPDPILGDA